MRRLFISLGLSLSFLSILSYIWHSSPQLSRSYRAPLDLGSISDILNDVPTIPHSIHQTGRDFQDNKYKDKWIGQSPDWSYTFYDDLGAAMFVKQHAPYVFATYEALPESVLRADLFRYVVLLIKGGLYSDTDTEVVRPLSDWPELHQDAGLVIGIEDDTRVNPNAHTQHGIQFCQWTIAARPNHPALKMLVDSIIQITPERVPSLVSNPERRFAITGMAMTWTGPAIFTEVILEYMRQHDPDPMNKLLDIQEATRIADVLVLPRKAFSNIGNEYRSESARIRHHFAGSWKPSWVEWKKKEYGYGR